MFMSLLSYIGSLNTVNLKQPLPVPYARLNALARSENKCLLHRDVDIFDLHDDISRAVAATGLEWMWNCGAPLASN